MDLPRLAADQKKAQRLKAHVVFIDESGLLMAPVLQRTWSPVGKTPILSQRTRAHQKVSAIAALSMAPDRRRLRLLFRLHRDINIDGPVVTDFLRQLLRQLPGSLMLIWDRWSVHRSQSVTTWRCGQPRLMVEWLPPYAPELNPVEQVWGYLKCHPLANWAPPDSATLATVARAHGRALQRQPSLLRAFCQHTPLPFDFQ